MNCQCCFSDEDQYEQNLKQPLRVYSQKELLKMDAVHGWTKQSRDDQMPKISLRRRINDNNSQPNTLVKKMESVSTALGVITQNGSQGYLMSSPQAIGLPGTRVQLRQPPPIVHAPRVQFTHVQLKIKQEPRIFLQNPTIVPIFQQPQPKRVAKPQVRIVYQHPNPIAQTRNATTHAPALSTMKVNNPAALIHPISVQFSQPALMKAKQQPSELTKEPETKRGREWTRKSSIELNRPEREQEFRGKMSQADLKRGDSVEMPEEKQQSLGLFGSIRAAANHHIEDIECKNTESVADANDPFDETSEVVVEHVGIQEISTQKKMTNSETKFGRSTEKNSMERKRSIIWESSRKESFEIF